MKKNLSVKSFAVVSVAAAAIALFASQSVPNISEIVVTKDQDTASSAMFSRPPNAKLTAARLNSPAPSAIPAYVDPAVLRAMGVRNSGTGKTMAAEVIAKRHYKSVKITMRKGGSASASQWLSEAAQKGERFDSLTLTVRETAPASNSQPYLEIKLKDVLISGYQVSGGGDKPTESLSINFTKIEYKYTPYDDQHKVG